MHDFCFTYPYGIAVFLGGILGYLLKGSIPSLAGGVISGSLLLFCGNRSLKAYQKRCNSFSSLLLETVISISLTYVMGKRYLSTSKLFPPGIVAAVSGVMSLFYLYKLARGGNHISKKSN